MQKQKNAIIPVLPYYKNHKLWINYGKINELCEQAA